MMYFWNIQLNGVTMMNLVVAIGISVEFVAHITRAFAVTTGRDKVDRSRKTLTNMGTSVSCHTILLDTSKKVYCYAS